MKLRRRIRAKLVLNIISIIGIVLIAWLITDWGQDTRTAAENAENAATEARNTTAQLQEFTKAVSGAVDDINDKNDQQTLILCRLILSERMIIPSSEEAEIERICQEELSRNPTQGDRQSTTPSSTPTPTPQEPDQPGKSDPPKGNPSPQQNTRRTLEQARRDINKALRDIQSRLCQINLVGIKLNLGC